MGYIKSKEVMKNITRQPSPRNSRVSTRNLVDSLVKQDRIDKLTSTKTPKKKRSLGQAAYTYDEENKYGVPMTEDTRSALQQVLSEVQALVTNKISDQSKLQNITRKLYDINSQLLKVDQSSSTQDGEGTEYVKDKNGQEIKVGDYVKSNYGGGRVKAIENGQVLIYDDESGAQWAAPPNIITYVGTTQK